MKYRKNYNARGKKGEFYQGEFKPNNPQKYKGTLPIVYRSSWERKWMSFYDLHEDVLEWGSETVVIPYYDPVRRKMRRYFTDFVIKIRRGDKIITQVIEIKPHRQTQPPKPTKGKKRSVLLHEQKTWATNQAKWEAAEALCRKNGWEFVILTEKHL